MTLEEYLNRPVFPNTAEYTLRVLKTRVYGRHVSLQVVGSKEPAALFALEGNTLTPLTGPAPVGGIVDLDIQMCGCGHSMAQHRTTSEGTARCILCDCRR